MTVHPRNSGLTQIGNAVRGVLLNCLRAYTARQQLYCNDLKSVGAALASGDITTDDAMATLHDLDGIACLDRLSENERTLANAAAAQPEDANLPTLGNMFMDEVMQGPQKRRAIS